MWRQIRGDREDMREIMQISRFLRGIRFQKMDIWLKDEIVVI
jgi:hypothetical protein